MSIQRLTISIFLLLLLPAAAESAVCVNKYIQHSAQNRLTLTLLTGQLTFDEAKQLAAAIGAGEKAPLEWQSEEGKVIARQFGNLKVVRPMPIACDDKPSGVVVQAVFPTSNKPGGILRLKLDDDLIVHFVAQKE
ncbi:MAG: hypothetical protein ABR517_09590 [Thermoanaerobaculia bacterium]